MPQNTKDIEILNKCGAKIVETGIKIRFQDRYNNPENFRIAKTVNTIKTIFCGAAVLWFLILFVGFIALFPGLNPQQDLVYESSFVVFTVIGLDWMACAILLFGACQLPALRVRTAECIYPRYTCNIPDGKLEDLKKHFSEIKMVKESTKTYELVGQTPDHETHIKGIDRFVPIYTAIIISQLSAYLQTFQMLTDGSLLKMALCAAEVFLIVVQMVIIINCKRL